MSVRVWCSRCEQGWVSRYRLGEDSFRWVCEECEGVWRGVDVVPPADAELTAEFESLGLVPLRSSMTPSGEGLVVRPVDDDEEPVEPLRTWCPSCGQGWVARFRLGESTLRWVCDECEVAWVGGEVGRYPDLNLETELEWLGLPPLWTSMTPSGEVVAVPRPGEERADLDEAPVRPVKQPIRAIDDSAFGDLTGGYFHVDWIFEHSTWQEVIGEFVGDNDLTTLLDAMGQTSLVLATTLADQRHYLLGTFNCHYALPDGSYRRWFTEVRDEIGDGAHRLGRVPASAFDDVVDGLDRWGIRRPTNGTQDWRRAAQEFGERAPIGEIFALLGAISLILVPSALTEPPARAWLAEVRSTIAASAANRWAPTTAPS